MIVSICVLFETELTSDRWNAFHVFIYLFISYSYDEAHKDEGKWVRAAEDKSDVFDKEL
jgi:hypothetical protein